MKVPLAVVGLSNSDITKAIEILNSGKLTMGENVKSFENLMASYLGMNHFIMVNSGSSANLLIFEYLLRPSNGKPLLKSGDGVLVPAIAWPTTIWPIIQLGLLPIFVDVNRDTFDIDLDSARDAILDSQSSVRAIFPIHPLGFGIDSQSLNAFAEEFSLVLINDVCESLGSWSHGKHAGSAGLASTFSFYFSHHITTMEGGGIATNSLEMANDLRSMRSHGWSRDRSDSFEFSHGLSIADSKFRFITTGYNVRPTEVQAGIGINQIAHIDEYVGRRRRLVAQVVHATEGTPLRVCGRVDSSLVETDDNHSWMMIPLTTSKPTASIKDLQNYLEENGVETRPVLTGNFLNQPAMSRLNANADSKEYPNADWISENCFLIGAHHDYTTEQVSHLVETIKGTKTFNNV
jgi:CDP-6-deoxy-D-xylo-4-hexulose-3-dehydrase